MSESAPLPGNELGYRRDGLLRYSYDCGGRWEASAAHRVWVEGIRALTDLIFFPLLYWFDRIFFEGRGGGGGGDSPLELSQVVTPGDGRHLLVSMLEVIEPDREIIDYMFEGG
jgi:hypothetical protein